MSKNTQKLFNKHLFLSLLQGKSRCTFVMHSNGSDLKRPSMINVTNSIFRPVARFYWAILITLLTFSSVWSQGFEHSFGGPKEDFGQALITTRDYGFLEVGFSEGELGDDNDFDIFVVRTDKDGTEIWSQLYDEGFEERAFDVIELDDASLLIVGDREETFGSPVNGYLLKISSRGEQLWSRTYGAEGQDLILRQIIRSETEEGGYLLTGSVKLESTGRDAALLLHIDEDGHEVWRRTFSNGYQDTGEGSVAIPGGYMLAINKGNSNGDSDIALVRTDLNGNHVFTKIWGTEDEDELIEDLILTQDGNIAFVGCTDNTKESLIAKADLNGDTLWLTDIDASEFGERLVSIIEEDDGTTLTAAGYALTTVLDQDVLLTKVNSADGSQVWQRRLGDDDVFNTASDVVATLEGGYAIAAYNSLFGVQFNDLTLYKTNGLGTFLTNHVRGQVYHSIDGCNPFETGDLGLKDWLVKAESQDGDAIFFGSTGGEGFFDIQVDTGSYVVSLLQKNNRWTICNTDGFTEDLTELYDSSYHEFPLSAALECPLLEVDLSAGPAIGCMEQQITLSYGNQGAITATEVTTEVVLDPALTFIGSNLAPASQNGQTLTFDLPDLAPNDQGEFIITVMVSCNGLVNQQSLTTEAVILPDFNQSCAPPSPDWDGVIVSVDGECDGDSIRFTIRNDGNNPLIGGPLNYIVVEDQILVREAPIPAISAGNTAEIEAFPNDGGTYRIIAEQSPNYNGSLFPTAVVEGCESGTVTEFSVGQVAQFPDNDGDLNIDILTQEVLVLTSGPDLALRAYPKGYQDSIVTPTTDLEYTVFFGLDSTEQIERVVIRDTLSPMLDFNTLEVGASSHPYDFVLQQNGVLKITFDSIQFLADGGTGGVDPDLQQGYVTYRLSQKPNNSVGTEINNRAAVYFDYRSPVQTNSVRHVVGCENLFDDNCILTNSGNFPQLTGVKVSIFPNPMEDRTTVRIEDWKNIDTRFEWRLYDNSGRLLQKITSESDQFEVTRQNLPKGSYPYELRGDGQLISNGSLIVQ